MPTFKVHVIEEVVYEREVEASTEEEAKQRAITQHELTDAADRYDWFHHIGDLRAKIKP
jgi:hypothetical protein